MGFVMGITAAVLAIAAGLAALIVWTALLFPRPTANSGNSLERRPIRCFLLGVLVTGFWGGPALVLINAPHGGAKIAGWVLLFPLVSILVVGLAGMSHVLGQRLRALSPRMTPLAALVRGAVTIELAMLPPFLGWFLFAPMIGITVVGAGTMGCFMRARGSLASTSEFSSDTQVGSAASPYSGSELLPPDPVFPRESLASPGLRSEPSVGGEYAQPA